MRCKTIQLIIDIIRGKAIVIGVNKLKVYNRLKNKKNIPIVKVIGDSHTSFFAGHNDITFKHFEFNINNGCDKLENFLTFHIGPALAYNLNRYNSKTQAREKIEYLIKKQYIKNNDSILLCFGCIDTSVHVLKHVNNENTIEDVCNNILNNYFAFIEELKQFNIYLWAALPQSSLPERDSQVMEKNKVVEIFNNLLINRAKNANIKVLSIYDKLINTDYTAKREYYSDYAHLNQKAWELAKEEIKKIEILKNVNLG